MIEWLSLLLYVEAETQRVSDLSEVHSQEVAKLGSKSAYLTWADLLTTQHITPPKLNQARHLPWNILKRACMDF